jgi:hypothetical protein
MKISISDPYSNHLSLSLIVRSEKSPLARVAFSAKRILYSRLFNAIIYFDINAI